MQSVSAGFIAASEADVREVSYKVLISFDKDFDAAVDFFVLNTSELDGPDILQGDGTVIQEWDKYAYIDYTDRVISLEWEREEQVPSSYVQAMGDVVFDNSDDFFTPSGGSSIDDNILPGRPIRLYAGFGSEQVQILVGLTEGLSAIDDKAKTATFHCTDFITWIFKRKLQESVLFVNERISDILDGVLQNIGLDPSQYDLDVSMYTIPYAFFEKDTTFGGVVTDLMEAEMGTFYLAEDGRLKFRKRTNFDSTPVAVFDADNTTELATRKLTDIINRAEVTGNVLQLQPEDVIYRLGFTIELTPGQTLEQFFEYQYPSFNVQAATYAANSESDGSGDDLIAEVTLNSQDDFSTASKLVFENTSDVYAYITEIVLSGTAVVPLEPVFVERQDDVSVEKYEEQVKEVNSKFIQSEGQAESLAEALIIGYSSLNSVYKLGVKTHPALQLGDQVTADLNTEATEYAISRIQGNIDRGKLTIQLQLRNRPIIDYFDLDEDVLNGPAVLSY